MHMPHKVLEELTNQEIYGYFNKETDEQENFLFEKDVSEAIGFSNGNDPSMDASNYGMLGVLSAFNFAERVVQIQMDAISKSADPFVIVQSDDPEDLNKSIAIQNIIKMSQNSSNNTTDGFPLILVLFQTNSICVNLLEVRPENSKT